MLGLGRLLVRAKGRERNRTSRNAPISQKDAPEDPEVSHSRGPLVKNTSVLIIGIVDQANTTCVKGTKHLKQTHARSNGGSSTSPGVAKIEVDGPMICQHVAPMPEVGGL